MTYVASDWGLLKLGTIAVVQRYSRAFVEVKMRGMESSAHN